MDIEHFWPYWKITKFRAFLLMIGTFLLFGVALGFHERLNDMRLLGFPLGVMMVGQVVVVLAIGLFFWYVGKQDQLDEDFGANEDL